MRDLSALNNLNIDFMGKLMRPALILSGTVLLLLIVAIPIRGFNFGLDFTGGTVLELGYQEPVELADVRAVLEREGFTGATVQHFGTRTDVMIRLAPRSDEEEAASAKLSEEVFQALSEAADGKLDLRRVEYVGPQVGEELREQGGLAVLFALIGILAYVSMRFEWRFAVGAVAATLHDAIFVMGVFAILQIPFDLTILAALLAVVGYSLNDTIVIFDRIRENFRKMRKGTVIEITNISVNQTLSRTIMTSGTTLLVLGALYAFGGEALSGFSLALIIGVFVGTYSTVFMATATVLLLGISRADLMPVPKEGAEAGSSLP